MERSQRPFRKNPIYFHRNNFRESKFSFQALNLIFPPHVDVMEQNFIRLS